MSDQIHDTSNWRHIQWCICGSCKFIIKGNCLICYECKESYPLLEDGVI